MENPSFIFSSDKLELKTEGENFFVEGYISTSDLDLVNDIVTEKCLLDMAEQMKTRVIKFDVEHESFKGDSNLEREINKTKIPVAKVDDFLMDKKGLKVRSMLNKHAQRFDEVKGSIEDGFLDAFSIAFIPVTPKVEIRGGKEVRLLDKINLLNVAFTGNPINTESKMTNVFAKSLEFLKGKEKEKEKEDKKKKKLGYKNYEKDGAHAHADSEPLGLHNHPEIEERIRSEISFLHDRVNNLLERDEPETMFLKDKEIRTNYNHISDNKIKLQEVKNMSEEEKAKLEAQKKAGEEEAAKKEEEEKEKAEAKAKAEKKGEEEAAEKEAAEKEAADKEDVEAKAKEIKSLHEKIESMEKEMVEVKALLKMPIRKSKPSQQDNSENFAEKDKDPLDLI